VIHWLSARTTRTEASPMCGACARGRAGVEQHCVRRVLAGRSGDRVEQPVLQDCGGYQIPHVPGSVYTYKLMHVRHTYTAYI
jgi:hypothetical protein